MFCVLLALSACASTGELPPVDDQSRGVRDPVKSYRVVVAGDTLYSIAWEIGRDYRTLAKWNNIRAPFIIHKGQRIKIKPVASQTDGSIHVAKVPPNRTHKVVAGDTLYSLARIAGVSVKKLAKWNHISSPYTIRPGQKLVLARPGSASKQAKSRAKSSHKTVSRKKTRTKKRHRVSYGGKVTSWSWPTKGRIIRRFGQNGKKGLEIAGRKGQPIRAAAAGKVVYQGSGLRGYGQLVIIKHNQDFLSAYAHCDRIVVGEGDVIKKGQQIASMGNTGTNKTKLHFEIRYRGSPVNPEKYLRRR